MHLPYSLSHAHLLPVLGYSCDGPRLCLIYPYMANGSLDAHLKDHTHLTPGVRVQIACDVSSALAYLHCRAQQIVIHRDVKRYYACTVCFCTYDFSEVLIIFKRFYDDSKHLEGFNK